MYWFLLAISIIFEVAGTLCLKQIAIKNSSSLLYLVIFFYAVSFVFMWVTLKKIDVSTVYVLWSGFGTVLICICGVVFFKEYLNFTKILAIGLILLGAILLKTQSA